MLRKSLNSGVFAPRLVERILDDSSRPLDEDEYSLWGLPYRPCWGQIVHHSDGVELFHVFLNPRDSPEDEPMMQLRHQTLPSRITLQYLETVVPEYDRLSEPKKAGLHLELSMLFTPSEIGELYTVFGFRWDLFTVQICSLGRGGCNLSELRFDPSKLSDPSLQIWYYVFDEKRQAGLSFRVVASGDELHY
jgi:hypothetical protein